VKTTERSELIKAGAKSYPQAFAALCEFCRMTANMLRLSVEQNLGQMSKSMALGTLSPSDLRGRANPSSIHPDAQASDGIEAKIGFTLWGDPVWRQYYFVTWGKNGLSLSASIKFLKNSDANDKVSTALHAHGFEKKIYHNSNRVGIFCTINPDELVDLPKHMNALLIDWSTFWNSVGGIAKCAGVNTIAKAKSAGPVQVDG